MTTTTTDTNLENLIINTLTTQEYNGITPNSNELYMVTDGVINSSDVTTALGYTPASNSAFTGADGTSAGASGLVPAPAATDNTKFLKGDGTWGTPSGSGTVDQTYDSTSTNAQSGTAVAGALTNYVTTNSVQTITAAKNIYGVDADPSGTGQANLLSVISNNSGTTGQWVGRLTVGANNKTFLMGTYNNMCILGAHSWTSAQAGTGAAWEPIYINSDGGQAVYIGGSANTASSGYFKVDNATGKSYINVGTASTPRWAEVSSITLQPVSTLTYASSLTISLSNTTNLYKLTPTGSVSSMTFSLPATVGASSTMAYTFELYIVMTTVYAITWPSNLTWMDGESPDLSSTGKYFLAFRTMDGGSTWFGNLQGKW